MPFDAFLKALTIKKGSPESSEHSALLKHTKGLAEKSRSDMARNYTTWDAHDSVFRSERRIDKEDRSSESKGQPKKLIVPLTFSQIMTFVAFSVQSVTQNRRFFELEPTGSEDNPLQEPMELILERDVRRNQWQSFLVQFFLDIGRFALGAAEVIWKEDYRMMRVPQETEEPAAFSSEPVKKQTYDFQKIPTFTGNRIYSVSPYRFLPDTRLPLTRYQEGEFCGSEDLFSMASLRGMGDACINLDFIPKMTEEQYKTRRKNSRIDLGPDKMRENPNLGSGGSGTDDVSGYVRTGPVVVTKMCLDIIPKDFEVDGEKGKLGDEAFPVRYIVWYANDKTIIKFEEAYYLHCQFPYICAQYLPDQHKNVNEGLADICDQMTNLITWLINAHVTSMRASVESKYIVDPAGVDIKSLESRSPYIFLKRNASQTGVDRYIKQFKTEDTTQNVMQDVGSLKELLEIITGLSSQMQGQYSAGRRSATQDRVVAQGAGARGKTTLGSIWDSAFEPLGKQLIANNRQEMDEETFWRILGTGAQQDAMKHGIDLFSLFKADPIAIATAEDFFTFDGTLPSEKAFLAQSLQEILMTILSNPEVSQILGYGPDQVKALFEQVYLLRGVTPARLPEAGPPQPPAPDPTQQQQPPEPPPAPRELISVKLPDLAGSEREQALAMFGIKADSTSHKALLRMENPPPTAKSNGQKK